MLGDPAARLPLARSNPEVTQDTDTVAPGHDLASDGRPKLALPAGVEVDAIELAIANLIAEFAREEDLAGDLGIPRKTLKRLRAIYARAGRRAIEEAID